MTIWINAAGYSATWLAAVIGAGSGQWWAGPIAAVIFVALHFALTRQRDADLRLLAFVLILGVVVDSVWAASGLLVFAAPFPSTDFAPLWILSIWAAFALTLNHCLRPLQSRPLIAAALGFFGAPLAYWAAARGWAAVEFATPSRTLTAIALVWALLTPVMFGAARFFHRRMAPA